jgi:PPOX class probable F420-dependent enzyme
MTPTQPTQTESQAFAVLHTSDVALLTTFRRNGQGVETPVGIEVAADKAYFTTWSTTGKVKRLVNNQHVTLAPYAKRSRKVTGPTVAGTARRLEVGEMEHLSTLFTSSFWDRLWHWICARRGWQAICYEVSPDTAADSSHPSSFQSAASS